MFGFIWRTRTYHHSMGLLYSHVFFNLRIENTLDEHRNSNFEASTMADNLRSKARMQHLNMNSSAGIPGESESVLRCCILVPQIEIDVSS
jgi:hypothetical protein